MLTTALKNSMSIYAQGHCHAIILRVLVFQIVFAPLHLIRPVNIFFFFDLRVCLWLALRLILHALAVSDENSILWALNCILQQSCALRQIRILQQRVDTSVKISTNFDLDSSLSLLTWS